MTFVKRITYWFLSLSLPFLKISKNSINKRNRYVIAFCENMCIFTICNTYMLSFQNLNLITNPGHLILLTILLTNGMIMYMRGCCFNLHDSMGARVNPVLLRDHLTRCRIITF